MADDFIQQTVHFLKYSDIGINYPSIDPVELMPDGTVGVHLCSFGFNGAAEIRENIAICVIILFGLIDMLVDQRCPELEGKSFRRRYDSLPSSNDYEIIFKEIYRIMRVLRNAIVHARSRISRTNDDLAIDYLDRRRKSTKLNMGALAVQLVFSLVVHYTKVPNTPYVTAILRSYYDDVLAGVDCFSDDLPGALRKISHGLRLRRIRYRVQNPSYQIDEGRRELAVSRFELFDNELILRGVDYSVDIQDKLHIIPDEALNDVGAISLEEAAKWVYADHLFFY